MPNIEGHRMSGRDSRDPRHIDNVIARYGNDVWMGADGDTDRGDRHSAPKPPRDKRKDAAA
jgi:hypothetical protein